MQTDITHRLPKIIAACNAHNIEAWLATFAPDALLNDMQSEILGAAALRGFAAAEIFGANVTMDAQ